MTTAMYSVVGYITPLKTISFYQTNKIAIQELYYIHSSVNFDQYL